MAQRVFPLTFVNALTNEEYHVLSTLREGITNAVFKAVGSQGDVALKVWYPEHLNMLNNDNQARTALQHHGVLGIRALFQHEPYFCQVLPWCVKQSIRDVAKSKDGGKFEELEAQAILQQVAVVVAAMHEKNRVHGKIQPSNILLDEDDRVLVNDFCLVQRCRHDPFGLCRYIPSTDISVDEITIRFSGRSGHAAKMKCKPTPKGYTIYALCDGRPRGIRTYMPPERLITPYRYGRAADVWAFGILMFEMLVGRLPMRNNETHEVEFGDDLEGLSKPAFNLIVSLLHSNHYGRPNFQEVLQHHFIRGQNGKRRPKREQDQSVEKPKKKKSKKKKQKSQQKVSQVIDTAT
ncbi:MAG: kinase-like domain-containing protein [Linnemannia gamsii]|nr:MAG: kinase-like domain-containing protein [Linnemannia gamsii]